MACEIPVPPGRPAEGSPGGPQAMSGTCADTGCVDAAAIVCVRPAGEPTHVRNSKPGFRCNLADVAMLAASLGLSLWMAGAGFGEPSWLPAYVTATFFLFCNVFRIGRPMEVAWSAVAVAAFLHALAADLPFWRTALPVTLPATAAAVAWAAAAGRYRGVFAKHP